MFEWYDLLITAFFAIIFNEGLRELRFRRANPHRYKCPEPGCYFKISSSDKQTIDIWSADHARDHKVTR